MRDVRKAYKYGDTPGEALLNRFGDGFYFFTSSPLYWLKVVFIWYFFCFCLLVYLAKDFKSENKIAITRFLTQKPGLKRRYTLKELLSFEKQGVLYKKLNEKRKRIKL